MVGFEVSHMVSDLGSVYSQRRAVRGRYGNERTVGGRLLTPDVDGRGRRRITLYVDGAGHHRFVSRLVAEAFIGAPPFAGALVRHLDDDRSRDHASNLAWGTGGDNAEDARRNGRMWQLAMTSCRRGHVLDQVNCMPARLPARICLACARAVSYASQHHEYRSPESIQVLADWYYARIIGHPVGCRPIATASPAGAAKLITQPRAPLGAT